MCLCSKSPTAKARAQLIRIGIANTPSTQIIVHFACQVGGLIPVAYLVYKYVTNTNYLAEKEVVFIPKHEAELLHIDDESISGVEVPVIEETVVSEKVTTK